MINSLWGAKFGLFLIRRSLEGARRSGPQREMRIDAPQETRDFQANVYGWRGLSPLVLLLGRVRMSEFCHLVTVSRWFFTTIVASGFVGSEPTWMLDTLKSKGWKNCPGNKNIHSVSPCALSASAITISMTATSLPRLMQRLTGCCVLSPGQLG